jgi:putative flippase GtrA
MVDIGIGVLGVIVYEVMKYLLKNRIKNHKIMILVSMILAIIVGSLIVILLHNIFK